MLTLPTLLTALWVASASAADVNVSVRGLAGVQAAVVIVDDGSGPQTLSCQDTGYGPDTAIDGSWTCDAFSTDAGLLWLVLAADEQLLRVGTAQINGAVPQVVIERAGHGARLMHDPTPLWPDPSATSAGPGTILITRLFAPGATQAPMLVVQTDWGRVQHGCGDDGALFDETINDEIYLCTGWLPANPDGEDYTAIFSVRQDNGENLSLAQGDMAGGPGIRFLTVDTTGEETPTLEHFSLWVRSGTAPAVSGTTTEEVADTGVATWEPVVAEDPSGDEPTIEEPEVQEGEAPEAEAPRTEVEMVQELDDWLRAVDMPGVEKTQVASESTAPKAAVPEELEGQESQAELVMSAEAADEYARGNGSAAPSQDPIAAVMDEISTKSDAAPSAASHEQKSTTGSSGSRLWPVVSLALAGLLGLSWVNRYRVFRVPQTLELVAPPRIGGIGPRADDGPVAVAAPDREGMLRTLVAHLTQHRRVVLLGIEQVPEDLQVGHPVYTLRTSVMSDALDAVSALARAPGPPVAVIVVDVAFLDSSPSLSPAPLVEFFERLDTLAWSLVLYGTERCPRPELPAWGLTEDGRWQRSLSDGQG